MSAAATSLSIVTGSSRGLGAAMAQQLLRPGARLLCLARQANPALAAAAAAQGVLCEQWQVDLAHAQPAAAQLQAWLEGIDPGSLQRVVLINNAALLAPPGPMQAADDAEIAAALRVGLEAPLLLTAAFLRATRAWTVDKRVLNISSGLGRRAMAGSAVYCATKAGLDHASRALALEQAREPHGARIVALAPGVIDTDMQVQLRGASAAAFPDRDNFVRLHEAGQLTSAAEAAARVLAFLDRRDFGGEPVADVRAA